MGLFRKFLEKLFGDRWHEAKSSNFTTNTYMIQWEKERQERIHAAEHRLKDWIVASINKNSGLSFVWESGNDEAFVTFKDDTGQEADEFQDLEEYIIDKLNIPDAGEFQMNGSGIIYIDGNAVKAKYSSTMQAIIDYDEATEQEIYSEEDFDNGDIILFEI